VGYEVEITRSPFFKPTGRRIPLEDWYALVRRDEELQLLPASRPEREPPLEARWLAHPDPKARFATDEVRFEDGVVMTKNPDEHLCRKMAAMARALNAVLVGDDGEMYVLDENGALQVYADGPPDPPQPLTYGLGIKPGRILEDSIGRDANAAPAHFYTWYLGFLSSFNQARHGQGGTLINYELTKERIAEDQAFLRGWCAENRDKPFVQAALALIRMHDIRLTPDRPSPRISPRRR